MDDRGQGLRELDLDLALLLRREDVHDPIDRLGRVVRVQRPEHQMAGLGDGEGRRDRLEIAHLADLDHVRILAKGRPQRARKGVRIGPDLALDDHRLLVMVDVLDGVLDRDDVDGPRPVDPVEHRRHGRRLPRPGRTGHEDKPVGAVDELVADGRRAKRFERRNDVGNEAQGAGQGSALEEEIRAHAGGRPEREAEVELSSRNELIPPRSGQRPSERQRGVGGKRLLLKADQDAVDSGRRRGTRRKQQVRSVAIRDDLKKVPDALIHGAGQCTVCTVAPEQVLIVSADERWLRVLEVTIRLGGAETISRRSVGEALRGSASEGDPPTAMVVDLGAQTSPDELQDVQGLVQDNSLPAVVILPEGLSAEQDRFASVGATVLVRPYRPSELYAALWPGGIPGSTPAAAPEDPLTVDEEETDDSPSDADAITPDEPATSDEHDGSLTDDPDR
jgi:hypothetical protein